MYMYIHTYVYVHTHKLTHTYTHTRTHLNVDAKKFDKFDGRDADNDAAQGVVRPRNRCHHSDVCIYV